MKNAAKLTILRNGETVKEQAIEGEAILGRAEGCVVRLEDKAVSRQHAILKPVDQGIQVEKKSEFAPLVVNGAECTKAVLKDGDVISIGPYLVKVALEKEQASAAIKKSDESELIPLEPAVELAVQPTAIQQPEEAQSPIGFEQPESSPAPEVKPAEEENPSSPDINLQAQIESGTGVNHELDQSNRPQELEVNSLVRFNEQMDEDGKTKVSSNSSVSVVLIFTPGAANHSEYPFVKDEVTIGRGRNCDIVLNDKKSSRKHAIIRKAGLNFIIKDLESANGTFVNGVKISEQELSGDDVIRVGEVDFQFKALSSDYVNQEKDFLQVPEEIVSVETQSQNIVDFVNPQASVNALPGHTEALNGNLGMQGVPGISSDGSGMNTIPGLTTKRKVGLYEKYIKNFKELKPRQKVMVVFVALGLFYFIFLDSTEPQKTSTKKQTKTTAPSGPKIPTFESLSKEQQAYVQAQYTLAFDHFKDQKFDMALYELDAIFKIIPDYQNSREIEQYAKQGKQQLEALEQERKKKEEEEKLKAQIAQLVQNASGLMAKKQYDQAKEMFGEILALDPDNIQVANWKKEIDDIEEQKRLEEQQKQVQAEINKRAWEMYGVAADLRKMGKCHSAIEEYGKTIDIGASDKKVIVKAKAGIRACRNYINGRRDPVLQEARSLEESGEYAKAYQLYKRAAAIDPPHPASYGGMGRIRGILHDRSKALYTEAVLAESYSDFEFAKKKFEEILKMAPEDDIYYERAKRKLSHYFRNGQAAHE